MALATLAWVAAGLCVHAALYLRYRGRFQPGDLPPKPAPELARRVDAGTLAAVGWVETDRASSFVHFTPAKRPGTVRIGCLGGSFTYGKGVGFDEDYPSLLQRELRASGYHDVEVLNFASTSWGLHQTFAFWERVGRAYGLDYIVLGPSGYHVFRDSTFNHSLSWSSYLPHARYILDGDRAVLMEPVGEDAAERRSAYLRFIPPWRYLRYDARPPAFLACLLPANRTLRNPFYYAGTGVNEEIRLLHKVLLRRMAAQTPVLALGPLVDQDWGDFSAGLPEPGLRAVSPWSSKRFPYRASDGHLSASGNLLIARQVLCLLSAKEPCRLDVVATGDPAARAAKAPGLVDFGQGGSLTIDMGGGRTGHLAERLPGEARPVRNLSGRGRALLALQRSRDKASILDALWLRAPLPPEGGDAILRFHRGDKPVIARLGALKRVTPDAAIWRLALPGDGTEPLQTSPRYGHAVLPAGERLAEILRGASRATLLVGDRRVLTLRRNGGEWTLQPAAGNFHTLHLDDGVVLDAATLPPSGAVDLVWRRGAARARVPIAVWRRETVSPAAGTGDIPRLRPGPRRAPRRARL